jgi:hypothetical protein
MLGVVMLSVVMQSVAAPFNESKFFIESFCISTPESCRSLLSNDALEAVELLCDASHTDLVSNLCNVFIRH